jgi:hypothetical protein
MPDHEGVIETSRFRTTVATACPAARQQGDPRPASIGCAMP